MRSAETKKNRSPKSGLPVVGRARNPKASAHHMGRLHGRPFLKWAGGKRQLLQKIVALMPEKFGTYHEPFVGGGALFFHVQPREAILSDRNERLIRAYK